jgi:anthranilate synthase/phosphoribosyltransferase
MAIDLPPERASALLDRTGFAFLFAPIYHQAMKHAGPVRRELGMKTIMNLLGPLANPAGARAQLIGVYDGELCLPMAQAAKMLGLERVMVVHGEDGLDEISVSGPTKAVFIDENDELTEMSLTPEELGIQRSPGTELVGGAPDENARLARRLLEGDGPGAVRDALLVNAGAALFVAGAAESAAAGCEAARNAFERGAVKEKLDEVVARSRELAAVAPVGA